jgi:hypothetical protein
MSVKYTEAIWEVNNLIKIMIICEYLKLLFGNARDQDAIKSM